MGNEFVKPMSAEDLDQVQAFMEDLLNTALTVTYQGFTAQGMPIPNFFLVGVCGDMIMPAAFKEVPAEKLKAAGLALIHIAESKLTEEKPWL